MEWKSRLKERPGKPASPLTKSETAASNRVVLAWPTQLEYSDRKLFLGMTLRPAKRASPSSVTWGMTWLDRSMAASLRASIERRAQPAGIILESGKADLAREVVESEAD